MSRFQISPARTPSTHGAGPVARATSRTGRGRAMSVGRSLNVAAGEPDRMRLFTNADAAQAISALLPIVAVGVTFNRILFAPLERRVAARWGFGPSVA